MENAIRFEIINAWNNLSLYPTVQTIADSFGLRRRDVIKLVNYARKGKFKMSVRKDLEYTDDEYMEIIKECKTSQAVAAETGLSVTWCSQRMRLLEEASNQNKEA